jgi:hypothetical protein
MNGTVERHAWITIKRVAARQQKRTCRPCAFENYCHGTLLTTVDEALRWAANMTWNGVSPFMHLVKGTYPKQALKAFAQHNSGNVLKPYLNGISPFPRPKRYLIYLLVP